MRHPGFAIIAPFPVVLALLVAPVGCSNRAITSICRQTCACSPCTRNDLDACMTTGQKAETTALKKNCGDAFDKMVTCLDENLSCQQGAGAGTDKCAKQEAALTQCAGIGNPFTTPCAEALQKTAACNGTTLPPGQTACPAMSACQSLCVLTQPCDVLNGMTFSQSFQDCQTACANITGTGGSTGISSTGFGVTTGVGAPH